MPRMRLGMSQARAPLCLQGAFRSVVYLMFAVNVHSLVDSSVTLQLGGGARIPWCLRACLGRRRLLDVCLPLLRSRPRVDPSSSVPCFPHGERVGRLSQTLECLLSHKLSCFLLVRAAFGQSVWPFVDSMTLCCSSQWALLNGNAMGAGDPAFLSSRNGGRRSRTSKALQLNGYNSMVTLCCCLFSRGCARPLGKVYDPFPTACLSFFWL